MKRPPKHWMRRCVRGVKKSGAAIDAGAVCGSMWHRKMSTKEKRRIVRMERRR